MSDKKEKKKKSKKVDEEEIQPQSNMISFNPSTDVMIKLGQLVNMKNLIANMIDGHPELQLNSDEVLRLGMWMEEINKYVRENAITDVN